MLRVILSVAGVGLILAGVFGDKIFNRTTDQGNDLANSQASVQSDVQSGGTAEESPAELVEVPAALPPVDNVATEETATDETLAGQQVVVETSEQALQAADSSAVVSAAPVVTPSSAAATIASKDEPGSMVESSTPEAIKVAASDEEKAADRNTQVALAKTIMSPEIQNPQTDSQALVADEKSAELQRALSATSGPDNQEVLLVIKDLVNMREGPSIDHPIVLQLDLGQELMEFKREGKWVHVGAFGTSGKIGWVHQRLVGPSE